MPFIPPNPNATCTCGMDTSTDGYRLDVVCPKHDGIFRVTIAANHSTEPLVSQERVTAIKSFRRSLTLLEEAYGVKLKVDSSGDLLILDQTTKLPDDYEWSAWIGQDGELHIADYVLDDETGATKQ